MEGNRKIQRSEKGPPTIVSLSSRQQSRPTEVRRNCRRWLLTQLMKHPTLSIHGKEIAVLVREM
jgi:hypothetical protein